MADPTHLPHQQHLAHGEPDGDWIGERELFATFHLKQRPWQLALLRMLRAGCVTQQQRIVGDHHFVSRNLRTYYRWPDVTRTLRMQPCDWRLDLLIDQARFDDIFKLSGLRQCDRRRLIGEMTPGKHYVAVLSPNTRMWAVYVRAEMERLSKISLGSQAADHDSDSPEAKLLHALEDMRQLAVRVSRFEQARGENTPASVHPQPAHSDGLGARPPGLDVGRSASCPEDKAGTSALPIRSNELHLVRSARDEPMPESTPTGSRRESTPDLPAQRADRDPRQPPAFERAMRPRPKREAPPAAAPSPSSQASRQKRSALTDGLHAAELVWAEHVHASGIELADWASRQSRGLAANTALGAALRDQFIDTVGIASRMLHRWLATASVHVPEFLHDTDPDALQRLTPRVSQPLLGLRLIEVNYARCQSLLGLHASDTDVARVLLFAFQSLLCARSLLLGVHNRALELRIPGRTQCDGLDVSDDRAWHEVVDFIGVGIQARLVERHCNWVAVYAALRLATAMSTRDAWSLQTDQIDPSRRELVLPPAIRTGRDRRIPISSDLLAALMRLKHTGKQVFSDDRCDPRCYPVFFATDLHPMLQELTGRPVDRRIFDDTAPAIWLLAGVGIEQIEAWCGWKQDEHYERRVRRLTSILRGVKDSPVERVRLAWTGRAAGDVVDLHTQLPGGIRHAG